MAWVRDSRFKDTYEYRGQGFRDKSPRRSIYQTYDKKGKKKYQVWETQVKYKGKPSMFTFQGVVTKRSRKLFDTKREANQYAISRQPEKI